MTERASDRWSPKTTPMGDGCFRGCTRCSCRLESSGVATSRRSKFAMSFDIPFVQLIYGAKRAADVFWRSQRPTNYCGWIDGWKRWKETEGVPTKIKIHASMYSACLDRWFAHFDFLSEFSGMLLVGYVRLSPHYTAAKLIISFACQSMLAIYIYICTYVCVCVS
jgi:hypothetical protein